MAAAATTALLRSGDSSCTSTFDGDCVVPRISDLAVAEVTAQWHVARLSSRVTALDCVGGKFTVQVHGGCACDVSATALRQRKNRRTEAGMRMGLATGFDPVGCTRASLLLSLHEQILAYSDRLHVVGFERGVRLSHRTFRPASTSRRTAANRFPSSR